MIFFSFFFLFLFGIDIGRLGVVGNEVRKGKREKRKRIHGKQKGTLDRCGPWPTYFILSYLTCSKKKTDSSSSFNSKSQTNNHDRESRR